MFGAFIAKRFVLRLEADMFRLVMAVSCSRLD